ncbi:signal peptidase I [Iocasia frigidifontis]|uniref:Signal peptidase I n=1 Tax=Iocasia fonsfrigidae TaxID=2682810 RepID=A0A8A7KEV5_9FIRM|nr:MULTISPECIES: signal peptidase I [Halanaerobiaceae]AZO95044.1 signal peptidase I [Halocella sp. SP3-1]MTI61318.1 signal peptidase I [Bacillota bacterium]QTL97999.1 signal peptidase I [Iocasia fonsfrigidae]
MIDSGDIKEFLQSLVIAAILAFFIITFIAQSFVVDGQSMEPTLHDGERLFVNKFIYRFHPPERLDIIVFKPHGAPRNKFIKRVIGLPGETIYIHNGRTFVDGEPLKEDYINEKMQGEYGPYQVPEGHVFVMGDNRNHSADSRIPSYVGYVDYKSISGKAFWVYWPLNKMRVIRHKENT